MMKIDLLGSRAQAQDLLSLRVFVWKARHSPEVTPQAAQLLLLLENALTQQAWSLVKDQ